MVANFTYFYLLNYYMTLSAGAAEYTDYISDSLNERPRYDLDISSNAGTLGNAEYPFIAIVPRSTLARSDST